MHSRGLDTESESHISDTGGGLGFLSWSHVFMNTCNGTYFNLHGWSITEEASYTDRNLDYQDALTVFKILQQVKFCQGLGVGYKMKYFAFIPSQNLIAHISMDV